MYRRTVEDIVRQTGGTLLQGDEKASVHGVTTDSRSVRRGQLFIPLHGGKYDGHDFIGHALDAGAIAALVAKSRAESLQAAMQARPEAVFIQVTDTLDALQTLAADARNRFSKLGRRVVAITGSVGKTTTKDMLAAMTDVHWQTTKTEGNFNNEIGLPLTILSAEEHTEALVLEMGMRGVGQIRQLARIARPYLAIITNVSPVHLELLGTVEQIASAKGELIEELPSDGVVVLNGDDPLVNKMTDRAPAKVVTFGLDEHNDVRAIDVVDEGVAGVHFTLVAGAATQQVKVPVPGRHNVYNALAAAAAAVALGLPLCAVTQGLERFAHHRSAMRMQFIKGKDGLLVINDAYNAAPASMEAALQVLSGLGGGRKVAVLGDMLELGSLTESAHRMLGEKVAAAGVDILIAVGQYAPLLAAAAVKGGHDGFQVFTCAGASEAAALAQKLVTADDVVLVKASRSVGLEVVAQQLVSSGDGRPQETKEDSG